MLSWQNVLAKTWRPWAQNFIRLFFYHNYIDCFIYILSSFRFLTISLIVVEHKQKINCLIIEQAFANFKGHLRSPFVCLYVFFNICWQRCHPKDVWVNVLANTPLWRIFLFISVYGLHFTIFKHKTAYAHSFIFVSGKYKEKSIYKGVSLKRTPFFITDKLFPVMGKNLLFFRMP